MNPFAVHEEEQQQVEFFAAQRDFAAVDVACLLVTVYAHSPIGDVRLVVGFRHVECYMLLRMGAAQHGSYACDYFADCEWLGDIVQPRC